MLDSNNMIGKSTSPHTEFHKLLEHLKTHSYHWAITGVAGFIGSNLLEALLNLNQSVTGLDSFITGKKENLEEVQRSVATSAWQNFHFIEGDVRDLKTCIEVCQNKDFILHQAALGSVPRSIANPLLSHDNNVNGTLNILEACKETGVKRIVYASSSSVYGDHPQLPKVEDQIGEQLSPYAVTKHVNELYAKVYARNYGLETIGLRYFNVFGKRQDPHGPYAAIIPKWMSALLRRENIAIYGDGSTSRDFTYVDNVVQLNLLAATTQNSEAINQVYNGACHERTTLNELSQIFIKLFQEDNPNFKIQVEYKDFRKGDVQHSLADIKKAEALLGYKPSDTLKTGISKTFTWYKANSTNPS